MSKNKTNSKSIEAEDTVSEDEDLVELSWYYSPAGVPVVIADSPDIFNRIDEYFGESIPVVLVQSSETVSIKTSNGATKDITRPCMYKLVQNLVGWSVTKVSEIDLDFAPIAPGAHFALPPIPWSLLDRVDAFLRRIHDEVGTEAIVLLTFDPTKINESDEYSSEGWGVLVPKQKNSAGHCEYDNISAHDDRPDEAVLVGSIHSHPNMPAYASETDHKDQADFDGLHITFGWYGSGPTEYHIEMTMQGKHYTLQTSDVFQPCDRKSSEDIEDWVKKVERFNPQAPKALSGPKTTGTTQILGNTTDSYDLKDALTDTQYRDQRWLAMFLGKYSPANFIASQHDLASHVIVVRMLADEKTCPVCASPITKEETDSYKCTVCWNYIVAHNVYSGKDGLALVHKVIEARLGQKLPYNNIEDTSPYGVVVWHREKVNGTFKQWVTKVQDPVDYLVPKA